MPAYVAEVEVDENESGKSTRSSVESVRSLPSLAWRARPFVARPQQRSAYFVHARKAIYKRTVSNMLIIGTRKPEVG